jgi:hypothetical protein
LRLLAAEVRAAAKHLGLPPYDRQRIAVVLTPTAPDPEAEDPWAALRRFPVINSGNVQSPGKWKV